MKKQKCYKTFASFLVYFPRNQTLTHEPQADKSVSTEARIYMLFYYYFLNKRRDSISEDEIKRK